MENFEPTMWESWCCQLYLNLNISGVPLCHLFFYSCLSLAEKTAHVEQDIEIYDVPIVLIPAVVVHLSLHISLFASEIPNFHVFSGQLDDVSWPMQTSIFKREYKNLLDGTSPDKQS